MSGNGAQRQAEYDVAAITDIPIGEGRAFAVAGEQIAIFRLPSGGVRALSAVCPHQGGPIADGQLDDAVVLCPLHLQAFALDTGCSLTGADRLRRYPVLLRDDRIVVQVVRAASDPVPAGRS